MSSLETVGLSDIPFLALDTLAGRHVGPLTFHDGAAWRLWIQTVPGRFFEMRGEPAEAAYFAAQPERPTDQNSALLDFLVQRANYADLSPVIAAIQDDLLNLSAAVAKLDLIYAQADAKNGATRMAATEVEYILLVCRSLFDFIQEMSAKLWTRIRLLDPQVPKTQLKAKFSDMVLTSGKPRSSEEIAARFHLPEELADAYARHTPVFQGIRRLRDNLVHRGYAMETIFRGETGFLIGRKLGPFHLDVWREDEIEPNDLAPLMPALGLIIHGTLAAGDDFARTFQDTIEFPPQTVPGMRLFTRGYFDAGWGALLTDASDRQAAGFTLTAGMADIPT